MHSPHHHLDFLHHHLDFLHHLAVGAAAIDAVIDAVAVKL
jgi:hypothetical protein